MSDDKFMTGGCWDYARALMDVLGVGDPWIVSVAGEDHHVVVRLGDDAYADAMGEHSSAEISEAWSIIHSGEVSLREATEADLVGFEEDDERYEEAVSDAESRGWNVP